MFAILILIVVIVVVAILGFAAAKPNMFRVQRSLKINAVPEKIFPQINDFHNWVSWSPWERMDPTMKKTFGGPAGGKGAIYEWSGDARAVGSGRMEITQSVPFSLIVLKLDFLKPIEGHNIAEFTLDAQHDATLVTWVMHGPARFISKLFQVFVSMDTMIGKSFEEGLANLKIVAEK
jgi:Polyketide cyclase / dehydrase and lipid transport